jgi:hypothetical protein
MRLRSETLLVASHPRLSLTAPFMGKSCALLTSNESFVDQIRTATGLVNSTRPSIVSQVVVHVLRSKTVASDWITQARVQPIIGSLIAYPDLAGPPITVVDCSIMEVDPEAYDGSDATTRITIRGALWNATL